MKWFLTPFSRLDTFFFDSLANIFAAYVNPGTLEEAAAWMAMLTRNHRELAEDFIGALQGGITAASKGVP